MNTLIRLTRGLFDRLQSDLRRPHRFAAERVAFVFGRRATTPAGEVVILLTFDPVDDDHYEDDPRVGARIGATAIHRGLQRASTLGAAAFTHTFTSTQEGLDSVQPISANCRP